MRKNNWSSLKAGVTFAGVALYNTIAGVTFAVAARAHVSRVAAVQCWGGGRRGRTAGGQLGTGGETGLVLGDSLGIDQDWYGDRGEGWEKEQTSWRARWTSTRADCGTGRLRVEG